MREFAPLRGSATLLFDQGYLGVTFFFVLSGFVLTWSLRPGIRVSTFYWRRFARVWPAHIVALALAVPVFMTLGAIPEGSFLRPLDIGLLLLSVLLIQGWWANPAVLFSGNPAAWTLSVEALFYALHPWISRLLTPLAKRGALLLALGALVWAFSFRLGLELWPESWLGLIPMPVTRVPEFVLGMSLAWAVRSGWRPRWSPLLALAVLAAVYLAIAVSPLVPALARFATFGNEVFTLAVGSTLVAYSSAALRGRGSLFASRWQVKLGEWSFAFYLVHATVIYLALRVFGFQQPSWRNVIWFVVLLGVAVFLAWALHKGVEQPLERRMRQWKDFRDARRAEATRPELTATGRFDVPSQTVRSSPADRSSSAGAPRR